MQLEPNQHFLTIGLARRGLRRAAPFVALSLLQACVFLPRTTVVYDQDCQIEAREMVLEMQQIGAFVGCHGDGCAAVLAGAGVVAAASAVVSGSIVIAGNIAYWFEKQGACRRREDLPPPPEPWLPPEAPAPTDDPL